MSYSLGYVPWLYKTVLIAYEDICRNDVWNLLSEGIAFNRAGRWWGSKDVEIDIVAYDSTGNDIVFGECKYSKNKKGMDVLSSLQEKAKVVNWSKDNRNEYYVLYSKSWFRGHRETSSIENCALLFTKLARSE